MLDFPMKNPLLTPALAAILGLALAGVPVTVHAQNAVTTGTTTASEPVTTAAPVTTTAPTTTTKPVKPKKTNYGGTLTAIDATASTITVQSSKNKLDLVIASTTIITRDKKPALLTDFVVGTRVTGSYTTDATTGTMTAAKLTFTTPKPKAPKAATPAAASTNAPAATPPAPATPVTQ